jgi:type IV pilus assembly protein PilW
MSLTETLVALAIGTLMIAGAATGYAKARDAYAALEANARLQETARYAMALIEADVRMAGFWGLTNRAESVTASASLAFPARCGGAAWVTDTLRFIDGSNNAWLPAPNCAALSGGAQPGTDVLVVRRASAGRITPQSATVAAPNRDRVLVVTDRVRGQVFVPQDLSNVIPPGYATFDDPGQAPLADTRVLIVHAYYISASSSAAAGYPALRRKTLTAGPDIGDEEIIAGVEDLQFQVGVDTNADWQADAFVNPGTVPATAKPVSVRIWLRLRAQERDNAFTDDRATTYADRTVDASGDHFRRLLVTKTLQLRNSGS